MPPAFPTPPLVCHAGSGSDVPHIDDVQQPEQDRMSRSTSATSSLDPYYFGIGNESPLPPLPTSAPVFSTTPDHSRPTPAPVTPSRDPADIDRRGLVGVGELATPRWTRFERNERNLAVDPNLQPIEGEDEQDVIPDSPWTIEAVDGEGSEKEQLLQLPRPLRSRPSLNEESGGEEILYPRSHHSDVPNSPPSAFIEGPRRARKRTSDEFEKDFEGLHIPKRVSPSSDSPKEKVKEPKTTTRRHKSLGSTSLASVSLLRDKGKERRRESIGHKSSRHTRQSSTGSSSTPAEPPHSRRVHTTDFSHLPPSPSTSSIQQILRHAPPAVTHSQSASNVAHSLLRGTQEGWSGMDDEATAEALRKLDGLGGKMSRSRASLISTSRPGTPPPPPKGASQWETTHKHGKDSDQEGKPAVPELPRKGSLVSEEDPSSSSAVEKTPKRMSARSSLQPKRTSGSSTNYTGTPTSRDSTSMSATTSVTSVSAASARSASKAKRNSGGSDNSSVHSAEGTSATSVPEVAQEEVVPPVPPLPKDLSSYRSPPSSTTATVFPSLSGPEVKEQEGRASLDAASSLVSYSTDQLSSTQHHPPERTPLSPKTPSKKWSFSGALNIKLSHSPSSSTPKAHSPRASGFARQLRKSISKEQAASPSVASTKPPWSPTQPDAMASAASLASIASSAASKSPVILTAKTPDNGALSHPETDSSSGGGGKLGAQGPLSPSSSIRRGQSTKRLTPSSIPFFRRSSSQSMQIPPNTSTSFSPPSSDMSYLNSAADSSASDYNPPSTSSKATPSKKASVLSLGLPSLLKSSSSRRSLHSDKESKEPKEDKPKSHDKDKSKKDDKDRSESRISVLMGRKRGKTVSSTGPPKTKPVASLPPMQISALPSSTAQKVANLKTSPSTSVPSTPSRSSSSRLTHQTISSLQKQSDSSLRSRNQLPTIAGSPSVAPVAQTIKEGSVSNSNKETPTKIPRISSRTGSGNSPTPKHSSTAGNRLSMNVNGLAVPSQTSSPVQGVSTNEFGVMEQPEEQGSKTVTGSSKLASVRSSPSTSTSRVPRQVSGSATQTRKSTRESISFSGLRKSSTSSVTTSAIASSSDSQPSHHRFSALSPSKGLKLLSPKISLTSPRVSSSSTARASQHSPSSSHPSLSTPSPTVSVDDDEVIGDKEMMGYIRRQQAKKLASGATQEELDDLLKFPEPLPPGKALTPTELLKSSQAQYLSEYEKMEIQDYSAVYCIGARSKKKPARPDDSTNNYGYDDDRGDYLVVNRDHLAYRYEVMDTLGKGSFGQVLHCRDHCTGESKAIKIIRNKKRFHHQALVEIKILDNLRKWDPDEKHHVIKMTDHFYFRNHLCIAMELLSINLYELIKANGFAGFSTSLIRRFTSQMLLSLSLMRHHRVVHCDLKPENVLLRHPAKSGIKVIDFGSSCFEHEKIYTYIQSRFYRSPEVILGMNYHMAIDMWSLGCILAELYTGFPIFPGENEQEQLACIMEVLGVPDKDFINRSSRKRLFFEPNGAPRAVVNSKGRRRKPGTKSLSQVLRCNDEEFIDFVAKCLVWDPERRIKPQAALRHPFILGPKVSRSASALAKSSLSTSSLTGSSRNKLVTETPKKSQISAPTPLTARSTRTTTLLPTTPSSSGVSASRSYRTQPVSYSSRTLNGLSSGVSK